MVKTRHSGGDVDEDLNEHVENTTLSITRSTNKSDYSRTKDSLTNGYHSDSSSGDRLYNTRHRHKKARRRYKRSSSHHNTDSDECAESIQPSSRTLRRRRSSPLPVARRTSRHADDSVMHEDPMGIRRSTRQRKFTYGTFNQNLMGDAADAASTESTEIDENNGDRETMELETTGRPKRMHKRTEVPAPIVDAEEMDMYTRVKRERRSVKRDMYGIPINEDSKDKSSSSASDNGSDGNTSNEEKKQSQVKSYNLRVHCPKTNLYKAPPIERRGPSKQERLSERAAFRNMRNSVPSSYRSPMRRRRKRAAFHSSDSSSTDSDDEGRFERRKSRSMAMARQRCLPMNLSKDDMAAGILRDRAHVGSSMADIEPMAIDQSVMFDTIGGLDKHLRALKEMIVFPLLYPEIFTRFKITPPRGVLFYGPPGTGKTLVARALANECSSSDTKVAFFMRKGADCLSKWVGESERQLRLLFDQAYQMRPSIIFFDEIDGLAPVRSSRQDQIHSSIVSTLLALMDGLDDRGEIVVIGATNRIDSIDPALRRPGRFDREFLFPLPPYEARRQILSIHTKEWNPRPAVNFVADMARKTVGYCGADIKALCTEAALRALRRRYPQIYNSREKLQIDVSSVNISAADFYSAMKRIVPTAQRSVTSPARPLSACVRPLLNRTLTKALRLFERIFPSVLSLIANGNSAGSVAEGECSDEEFTENNGNDLTDNGVRLSDGYSARQTIVPTHRPRLLLSGEKSQGQSSHLGPALLHQLECLPVHVLDLAALYSCSAKTPEEACTQVLREAQRTSPSVIYVPHLNDWWHIVNDAIRATFISLLNDLDPCIPVLLLATTDVEFKRLPAQARDLFSESSDEVVVMHDPDDTERKEFFEDLLLRRTSDLPPTKYKSSNKALESLPKATQLEARKLTPVELKRLREQEETTLRELRLFLRDVINKLGRDRKFAMFAKPVDIEDVPDYYEIIQNPMDLSSMMTKIDLHKYQSVQQFLKDIDLICSNALEYNPDRDPQDRAIRHRACALKDTADAIIAAELDTDFEKMCEEIMKARERRGEDGTELPSYYFTKPTSGLGESSASAQTSGDCPQRYSRRARGLGVCFSPVDNGTVTSCKDIAKSTEKTAPPLRMVTKRIRFRRATAPKSSHLKSPWLKGRRRPMYRKVVVYIDKDGNEVSGPQPAENEKNCISASAGKTDKKQKPDVVSASKKLVSNTLLESVASLETTGLTSKTETSHGLKRRISKETGSSQPTKMLTDGSVESVSDIPIAGQWSSVADTEERSEAGNEMTSHTLLIDTSQCSELLSRIVSKTQGYNVEQLLRLHNQLSLCVYQHRHNYDKSALLKDLELCLLRHTEHRLSPGSHRQST